MRSLYVRMKIRISAFGTFEHLEIPKSKRSTVAVTMLLKQFEKGELYCFPSYLKLRKEEKVIKYV